MTAMGPHTAGDRLARPLVSYVLLAYGISWLLWVPALLAGGAAGAVLLQAGVFGPAVAAGLVVWWSGGSVRAWLRPLLRWRVPARYWGYAIGLPVMLALSVDGVLAALGEQLHPERLGPATASWLAFVVLGTPVAGLQEELGWRGFALDRLQAHHSPLRATVLLGLIWGLWHLPLYGIGILAPALFAVPFTWLWNRTGSLLLCAVLHAAGAASFGVGGYLVFTDLTPAVAATILGVLLVADVALVVATRGRLNFDHRPEPVAGRVADIGRATGR
jgi:membrane protease YdiL (CAAX protease family)